MKKGLTPIISTFLLLIISVGLGTMVMSWGNVKAGHGCKGVSIGVVELNGRQLCSTDSTIEATLENDGYSAITSVQAVILDESSSSSVMQDVFINPGEFSRISIPAAKVLKIRFIPYAEQACIESRIEYTDIRRC